MINNDNYLKYYNQLKLYFNKIFYEVNNKNIAKHRE